MLNTLVSNEVILSNIRGKMAVFIFTGLSYYSQQNNIICKQYCINRLNSHTEITQKKYLESELNYISYSNTLADIPIKLGFIIGKITAKILNDKFKAEFF